MDKYWKPALTAGIVVGVISAIPVINFLNCCCLWIILGIIWSVWMYRNEYGYVDIGPGAALGATTGAIMGLVSGFLNIIVWAILGGWYQNLMMRMMRNFNLPAEAMRQIHMTGYSVVSAITGIITTAIVGTIVGLIMGAIWRKPPKKESATDEPMAPPEPPLVQ